MKKDESVPNYHILTETGAAGEGTTATSFLSLKSRTRSQKRHCCTFATFGDTPQNHWIWDTLYKSFGFGKVDLHVHLLEHVKFEDNAPQIKKSVKKYSLQEIFKILKVFVK